jgi:hypothetical protein
MNETSNFTPLEERLANLTTGINGMADGQKILVNKAFLEHVRDDMVDLLTSRRSQLVTGNPVSEKPDNTPLTLDELRQMVGDIVYCTPLNDWAKVTKYGLLFFGTEDYRSWREIEAGYGKTWLAYRRKPKDAT